MPDAPRDRRPANDTPRDRRPANDEALNREVYPPGAEDDVTVPPTDPVREAKQRDIHDPADVDIDPEEFRQGGPTRSKGIATTTGGVAGPAMRPGKSRSGTSREGGDAGKVAPTTTGDATSGGMDPPGSGTTSDATGSEPAEREAE